MAKESSSKITPFKTSVNKNIALYDTKMAFYHGEAGRDKGSHVCSSQIYPIHV